MIEKCIIIIKEMELTNKRYRRDLERVESAKISSVGTFQIGDTSE